MPIPCAERKAQLIGGLALPRANVLQAAQAVLLANSANYYRWENRKIRAWLE